SSSAPARSWDELAADTSGRPYIVDLKLTPLGPPVPPYLGKRAVVLCCGHEPARDCVLSRALNAERYYVENLGFCSGLSVRGPEMSALLDSISALPAIRSQRVDDSDFMSVTLRRVVAGREAQFECTMAADEAAQLTRMLARAFHMRREAFSKDDRLM